VQRSGPGGGSGTADAVEKRRRGRETATRSRNGAAVGIATAPAHLDRVAVTGTAERVPDAAIAPALHRVTR
jgi:hypothetical protein